MTIESDLDLNGLSAHRGSTTSRNQAGWRTLSLTSTSDESWLAS